VLLLQGERGCRARQLALRERHLVDPGVRQKLHVREVPVVVSRTPMPEGPVFAGACAFSQRTNFLVASARAAPPRQAQDARRFVAQIISSSR